MTNQKHSPQKPPAGMDEAIAALLEAAFGGNDESSLVSALRAAGDVLAELAVLEAGAPIGHILFSPLNASPGGPKLAALAPLAVRPDRQGHGIGIALVTAGLAQCRAQNIDAVTVLGDPAYYTRFGFTTDTARTLRSPYDGPHFMALELKPGALNGGPWRVTYASAFEVL